MFDISICIPTYNRSRLLQECLEHLANFTDTNFELIIGDNASEDATQAVMAAMGVRFPYFVNLLHKCNIGFACNMDSVLRRASRKYVYILSDDDIVYEEALRLSMSVMDANERIVAIVGQYLSFQSLDSTVQVDYSDAVASTVPQGEFGSLLNHLLICDGHPIMRRDVFERHCAYLDRTGALIPLYFRLLQYGDVIAINKPFFQHRTTTESLTSRMAEAWFLDLANADIELIISQYAASLPAGSMNNTRQQLLQLLYLQAARMSIVSKTPYLLWLFLRRLMAVEGATEELLLKCEYHFSHDFLVDRIVTILKDSELGTVCYVDTDIARMVVSLLEPLLPNTSFVTYNTYLPNEQRRLLICECRSDMPDTASVFSLIAINDIFEQVRLTQRRGRLVNNNQRLFVEYEDSDVLQILIASSHAFQIICSPYSEAD